MATREIKIRIGDHGLTGNPANDLRHLMVQDIRPEDFSWGTYSIRVALIVKSDLTAEEEAQLMEEEMIPNPEYGGDDDEENPSHIVIRRRKYMADEDQMENLLVNTIRQIQHLSFSDRDIGVIQVGGANLFRSEWTIKPRLASEVYG